MSWIWICIPLSVGLGFVYQTYHLLFFVVHAGQFCFCSWWYRLQNVYNWFWQHSWTWYYLCPTGLLLLYLNWFGRKIIVWITTKTLVHFTNLQFLWLFNSCKVSDALHICFLTRPGGIQARGDNLFNLIKAFTNSSKLENAHDRALNTRSGVRSDDEQPMFFDYLSWFLVWYNLN